MNYKLLHNIILASCNIILLLLFTHHNIFLVFRNKTVIVIARTLGPLQHTMFMVELELVVRKVGDYKLKHLMF